jgi:very-short-patch-repair endonuclease
MIPGVWSENPDSHGKVTRPLGADAEIARLARVQHGIVRREQVLAAGLNRGALEYRVQVGRLIPVHRGVFAVGHLPTSPHARAMAAVMACGPGAVLSHRSAAALWDIEPRWRDPIEVTARGRRRHPGIRVHRAALDERDVTDHHGIPVTSAARTLLDLADVLDDAALTRAVNDARLNRRLALDTLAELLERSPGRATTRLRAFVRRPTAPTRSAFEDAFLAMLDRYGIPRPEVNQVVAGHEVDGFWREQGLVVELDSHEYHDDDESFETDRDRDADLLAAGLRVVRVTWMRLTLTPAREAGRLNRLLARAA